MKTVLIKKIRIWMLVSLTFSAIAAVVLLVAAIGEHANSSVVVAKYKCVGDGFETTYHVTVEYVGMSREDRFEGFDVSKSEFEAINVGSFRK